MASKSETTDQVIARLEGQVKAEREALDAVHQEQESLRKTLAKVDSQGYKLRDNLTKLESQLAEAKRPTAPFQVGDIVTDELDVRYRVAMVFAPNDFDWNERRQSRGSVWPDAYSGFRFYGIRLSANGVEAHVKPRPLLSPNLTIK